MSERQGNTTTVRLYRQRQKKRGKQRLDVWLSTPVIAKLKALHDSSMDKTLSQTLSRIILARRSKKRNFKESLHQALDKIFSGTE